MKPTLKHKNLAVTLQIEINYNSEEYELININR